jgi:hypothetical protein
MRPRGWGGGSLAFCWWGGKVDPQVALLTFGFVWCRWCGRDFGAPQDANNARRTRCRHFRTAIPIVETVPLIVIYPLCRRGMRRRVGTKRRRLINDEISFINFELFRLERVEILKNGFRNVDERGEFRGAATGPTTSKSCSSLATLLLILLPFAGVTLRDVKRSHRWTTKVVPINKSRTGGCCFTILPSRYD